MALSVLPLLLPGRSLRHPVRQLRFREGGIGAREVEVGQERLQQRHERQRIAAHLTAQGQQQAFGQQECRWVGQFCGSAAPTPSAEATRASRPFFCAAGGSSGVSGRGPSEGGEQDERQA